LEDKEDISVAVFCNLKSIDFFERLNGKIPDPNIPMANE